MKLTFRFMIYFLISFLIVFSIHAQSINEIPMYGEKPKAPELLKADQEFIKKVIEATGSREKAAQIAIKRGWEYIEKNDPKQAIKRFNQAWLLTPNDGHVYWGFGAAMGQQGKLDESIKFFDKATAMLPNNARLLCDFGFSYIWRGKAADKSPREANIYFDKATSLFKQASSIEPTYERIYANWAILLFFRQDYKGAWEKVKQAESLGGKTIDKNFIDDLSRKMKRPL
jgi:tetratricopeptide (TPR) repeat protein